MTPSHLSSKMAASMSDVSPLLKETNGEESAPKNRILGKFGECLEQNVTRRLQIRGSFLSSKQEKEESDVVSVFVVTFDTKSGNTVEWSLPEDIDLDGVEFKSMPSGAHTTVSDFTYFRIDNLFGLSCFAKMSVDSEAERGARMKSVGLLSTSYTNLYKHMQFLEAQVRIQLETPGRYDQLGAFYHDHKSLLPATFHNGPSDRDATDAESEPVSVISSARSDHFLPHMKITHPAGCFSQFINFFGDNIFTLWKYVLLRRRILFFSPPPIGVVCFRVYCACMLGQYEVKLETTPELKPFFYINIADIDNLESELSYVACTTESIFQEKKTLFDVYVDNQDITTHIPRLKDMAKVNKMDREKFNFLNNQRCVQMFRAQQVGDEEIDDDHLFSTFFTEQNNHIFQTLLDASKSVDKTITSEHVRDMGLDPVGDRQFLMDLLELYGIDVILMVDNPCCPV